MDTNFAQAQKILKNGGIGLLPTDTTYIITCRIDNKSTLERLFAIKERSSTQAVPVLVCDIDMAKSYVAINQEIEEKLIQRYWPGALTVVASCDTEKVLPLIRGQGQTLGVRQPNYPELLEMIRAIGVPIVGTSANFHGKPTAYAKENLDPELIKMVDCVVDGKTFAGNASTVIDCSQKPWKILRQGAIEIPQELL